MPELKEISGITSVFTSVNVTFLIHCFCDFEVKDKCFASNRSKAVTTQVLVVVSFLINLFIFFVLFPLYFLAV